MGKCDRCGNEPNDLACSGCGSEAHGDCSYDDAGLGEVCGECWAILSHVEHKISCSSDCGCEERHADAIARAKAADMSITEQIDDEDIPVDVVVESIRVAGGAEIEASDDEPDAMNSDSGALWVVSNHRLLVAGEKVAEWTRCSVGSCGASGSRADAWTVEEDTNGGDQLPERIAEILAALELEDECPDVPEPADPEDKIEPNADGEWCVYWETVGDDAHVVARYATEDDATRICAAKEGALKGAHPGNLLCGYSVRRLVDGEWVHSEAS